MCNSIISNTANSALTFWCKLNDFVCVYIYILRYNELWSVIMILLSCRDRNIFFLLWYYCDIEIKMFFFKCLVYFRSPTFLCFVLASLYIGAIWFRTWIVKILEFQTYNMVQQLVIDNAFICHLIPLLSLFVDLGLNVLFQVHLDFIVASPLPHYNILCWLEI